MKLNLQQKMNIALIAIFLVIATCTYVCSKCRKIVPESFTNPIVASDSTFAVVIPE